MPWMRDRDVTTWSSLKKRLEVPKDKNAAYSNDSLTNRDIIPIPPDRRTWKPFAYAQYWVIEGISITGYTQASSLIGYGLSPKQSILCALAAGIIYGFFAALMGYIGGKSHIGFPVLARMVYGIKGSTFGIVIRIITGLIWLGVQAMYGGRAVCYMIATWNPSFANWDSFNNANGITSSVFVGLILYYIFMIPCLYIPPEKLHLFFRIATVLILGTFFGMLGYSVKTAGGAGTLFNEPSQTFKTSGELGWACVKGIFSIVGSAGTGILGQADFTRYSTSRRGPIIPQILGAPIALTFSCIIGVITTSASSQFLGEVEWNPTVLLNKIQQYEGNSSKARAAIFFGCMSFVLQQMAINLMLNCISSSMDMVGLCPKYINIRRGSYLILAVSLLIWPWKILTSAKAVVVFGSGWGVFCSAQTGSFIAKYFILYKRKVLLKDLYIRSNESIYWFYNGWDWRSLVSFLMGTVFMIPGLVWDTLGKSNGFWTWIYQVSYATGIILSMGTQLILEYMFPTKTIQPTTKEDDVYHEDGSRIEQVIDSQSVEQITESFEAKEKPVLMV